MARATWLAHDTTTIPHGLTHTRPPGDNHLVGGLEPLEGCAMLQVLCMAGNQLTGSLAPLESCTALRDLDLANNELTGSCLPLQRLELTGFDLRGNQLTDGV